MATIGQQLTAPESGWKRYDDTYFTIDSNWSRSSDSSYYNGTRTFTGTLGAKASFKFKGTKFRIITLGYDNQSKDIKISIDGGAPESFSSYSVPLIYKFLAYEKTGLSDQEHTIEIINNENVSFNLDAIDIDEIGYVFTPIGYRLTTPEAGWKRYDSSITPIVFMGPWTNDTSASNFNSTNKYSNDSSSRIKFNFIGTKIRLIGWLNTNRANNIKVTIDGVDEIYSAYNASASNQALLYEKNGLSNSIHTVEISCVLVNASTYYDLDAIDIDSTGRLLHPDEVTDPKDLVVGKRIRANYQVATSGQIGSFSGLGQETADFIQATSSNKPSGDFYFIAVDEGNGKKKLISDRNVQHSISWDTLNSTGIASGSGLPLVNKEPAKVTPTLTATSPQITATSEYSTLLAAWKAFDGKLDGEKWVSKYAAPQSLTVDNGNAKSIFQYRLSAPWNGLTEAPKSWKLYGSTDNANWNELDSRSSQPAWTANESRTYDLSTSNSYRYYKFEVTETQGGTVVAIGELELIGEKILVDAEDLFITTRLLTGGTSSTDKDNEWDQYIVSGTGNGAYTAGDNVIWNSNQNIWTWTSTVNSYGSSYRTLRGQSGVSASGYNTTNIANNGGIPYGFRPVLEIEKLSQPPVFEGSISHSSVHKEDVNLTGTINNKGAEFQYSILVNGVEKLPPSTFAATANLNTDILNSWLTIGENTISIYMINATGDEATETFTVTKTNTPPYGQFSLTPSSITRGDVTLKGVISNLPDGYSKDETWTSDGEVFIKPILK